MVVAFRKIRSHGHRLPAKVMELSVGVIGTMVALPLVMIARCLRPWILIRFGTARADVIGHSIFDLTYYLSNKYLSRDESHDFFYFRKQDIANVYWTSVIHKKIRVIQVAKYCDKINQLVPGGEPHIVRQIPAPPGESRDREGVIAKSKVQFQFSQKENGEGRKYLENLGMAPEEPYVCLIGRDAAYKKSISDDPGKD